MKVLVTGASGFVGTALIRSLSELRQYQLVAAFRSQPAAPPATADFVQVADLNEDTDWSTALEGVDTIVHLAARAHVMSDASRNPLAEFRRVNVAGTLNLARQAAASGIKHFIYLSSIKVNGEASHPGQPFTEHDFPTPQDSYGISKYEAEAGLHLMTTQTGLTVTIIRPPLVYGPGVKANFLNMIRWVNRGIPLPLGAIDNRRSLLALDNLVDFIRHCIDHPAAINQTFLVSDGEDLSTTELLRRVGKALNKQTRLLPVPPALLKLGGMLLCRSAVIKRLCESLQVDISKARGLLGWIPPITVDEGLRRAVKEGSC